MISSTKNDQVKMVVELRKKAKARNEAGLFVAEGLRMVSELPPERAWRLYVSESFLKNRENAGLLERFSRYEIVTDQVFPPCPTPRRPRGSWPWQSSMNTDFQICFLPRARPI